MGEVRHGIDRLDEELLALLGERPRYMEVAARMKPRRDLVRDEARKAEVIPNARAAARREGVPEGLVGELWERLDEGSIAHELEAFDRNRA